MRDEKEVEFVDLTLGFQSILVELLFCMSSGMKLESRSNENNQMDLLVYIDRPQLHKYEGSYTL